ncbi:hypothetical protein ACFYYH_29825 [Streptomyces sp. NPDC002018]|uniref:hypothetical protein n=1 Tax=Streptomyces sp. NPDC002018 TaxID=3364629 RepID=UPI00369E167A
MVRNIIGSILALAAAAAAVLSPFLIWFDGRRGHDYRVADLFGGITSASSAVVVSLLLPFAFAALVTLVGLVLRSRLLVAAAGVIVLGFTVLWMVRQGQLSDGIGVNGDGSGLGLGVAYAVGGGLVLLLASLVMSGRARSPAPPEAPYAYPPPVTREPPPPPPEPAPQDDWGPYGAYPYDEGPRPYDQGERYGAEQPPAAEPYTPPVYGHPEHGPHKYGPPQPYEEPRRDRPPSGDPQDGDTQSLPVDEGWTPRDDEPPRR